MTKIQKELFGITKDGKQVSRYILTNENGMQVYLIDFSCAVQKIIVPDKSGNLTDIVLGYDDLKGYEQGSVFFGVIAGRYANRILNAAFDLDGKHYTLPKNDGENHLHGVLTKTVFSGSIEGDSVVFSYLSPDMEEGYPGNVDMKVRYSLLDDNTLRISYSAETDAPTVVNLTNHSYFNLNGQDGSEITDHLLTICADKSTEVGAGTVPTGRISAVKGTPLDFTSEKAIGKDLRSDDSQMTICGGFDHNYILNGSGKEMKLAARLRNPENGLVLECRTTQPAMQLYSGNFLAGDAAPFGKNGLRYPKNGGVCLETQHYPCSPNFPDFPSTVLRPGEKYEEITDYRIYTEE